MASQSNRSGPEVERVLLTPATFAKAIDMSPWYVRARCRSGEIRSIVINARGDRLIPRSELARLLAGAQSDPS